MVFRFFMAKGRGFSGVGLLDRLVLIGGRVVL
jgi:hypothetical protein